MNLSARHVHSRDPGRRNTTRWPSSDRWYLLWSASVALRCVARCAQNPTTAAMELELIPNVFEKSLKLMDLTRWIHITSGPKIRGVSAAKVCLMVKSNQAARFVLANPTDTPNKKQPGNSWWILYDFTIFSHCNCWGKQLKSTHFSISNLGELHPRDWATGSCEWCASSAGSQLSRLPGLPNLSLDPLFAPAKTCETYYTYGVKRQNKVQQKFQGYTNRGSWFRYV